MHRLQPDIPLALVGCDFRVASSHWRSKLVLAHHEALEIASDLEKGGWGQGFVDLGTCNRNEWIVCAKDPRWAGELLKSKMLERLGADHRIEPYLLAHEEAAQHLFRVVIGQESLVVGERQIATQVFKSFETARERGTSCRALNGLSSVAGKLLRVAMRRNRVGTSSSGVHSLALAYLRHRLADRSKATVAVVGLGSIGRRVGGLLEQYPGLTPIPCNRTVPPGSADRIQPLDRLGQVLGKSDAAIVATGARQPVIRSEHLLERDPRHPLLVIDIGIPHQVTRDDLPAGVEVAGLDQLTAYHEESRGITEAARQDQAIADLVDRAVEELARFCNEPTFAEVLDAVQKRHRKIATKTLPALARDKFDYLTTEDRSRLEADLRSVLLSYDSQVFKAIREAAKSQGKTGWANGD